MLALESHPISVVYDLVDRYDLDLILSFSRYRYTPRSLFDERETFTIAIGEVNLNWLSNELETLRAGWDIALNSLVVDGRGRSFHLPMIDFSPQDFEIVRAANLNEIVGRDVIREMIFFSSGRSFHGYGTKLLGQGEWIRFMGRLLLLNVPEAPSVVDSRWVGHRLLGGFSALRWSANSSHYKGLPERMPRGLA